MISLQTVDPLVARLIQQEAVRQRDTITLIASENYTSIAVREATASVLTNKYAEGYPGKRYYAGCEVVDQVEQLAIDRCKQLFGAPAANVQPHAGSPANFAVYTALLKPGDTILGMSLTHGGHLTHGHGVNLSGMLYHAIGYGVDENGFLNYAQLERLAHQHKPKLIIVGASAYPRIIDFERCAQIARDAGAILMADIAHIAGLIAAGIHPSPLPHADVITSTTHKTLRGPRGGLIMTGYGAHNKDNLLAPLIDRAIIPGMQGGPLMNTIAAKAVCFLEAAGEAFVTYQKQVILNAQRMARVLQELGYCILSGGTDNHLFVVDLRATQLTGRAANALEQVGIMVTCSCVPNDPQKPWITSGIRIGTPAATTRGMTLAHAERLAHLIHETLQAATNQPLLQKIGEEVKKITQELPVPE